MLSRSRASLLRSLSRRRVREREGRFLAEGVRVVEELLGAGIVPDFAVVSSSLEDTERGAALAGRLRAVADVTKLDDAELADLAATESPQGVLAVARVPGWTLADVRADAPVVLVLDGVQDPGNLGTLARTAAALGAGGVLALPGTVDAWNPKAVRAAAGAMFRLPVVYAGLDALARLREGRTLLGADAAGPSVEAVDRSGRLALVLGNEGGGLSEGVRAQLDGLVAVPMAAGTESLNVAAAGAILLYVLARGSGG